MNTIWAVIEHAEGSATDGPVKPVSHETVNAARQLAGPEGTVTAVVLCDRPLESPETLIHHGADRVLFLQNPALGRYESQPYLFVLKEIIANETPSLVVLPATIQGKEIASALSATLSAGLVTDCTQLQNADGTWQFRRPVFAGKAYCDVEFDSCQTRIVTLRPNMFRGTADTTRSGDIETREVALPNSAPKLRLKEVKKETGALDITEASIVVSGGMGMQGPENFQLLEDLAKPLNAAVGASRPVVDEGWRPYSSQVGQTGRTVSPNLYIACGISGAVQHLAGMSSSRCIVAINTDPNAAIFEVADYKIVGNALEIVPALTKALS